MHGWQKLSQMGVAGVAGFLGSLGIPLPELSAAVLIVVEFAGGLALLAGALTRVTAALIAINMAVATWTVHLAGGFFLPQGYEFTFTLGLVALALVMSGAGRYSVDYLVTSTRRRDAERTRPQRLAA
jgi:putative oxidoreductase